MKMRTGTSVLLIGGLLMAFNCAQKAPEQALSRAPAQEASLAKQDMAPSPVAECKRPAAKRSEQAEMKDDAAPATMAQGAASSPSAPPSIPKVFIPLNTLARERYLAYSMDLSYKCDEFLKARKLLIDAVPKAGFILSCETTINEYGSSLTAVFKIKQDSLYNFIKSIEPIGYLQREFINGVDHTGEVFFNSLQIKRQKERVGRKAEIAGATSVYARSFDNREEELTNQEDVLDQREYEKWQFNDQISWVEVRLQLTGPQKTYQVTPKIVVPQYKTAFYTIISGLLAFSVALLYVVPFILIAGLIYWIVRKIIRKLVSVKSKC
jgi:hypothetical protein